MADNVKRLQAQQKVAVTVWGMNKVNKWECSLTPEPQAHAVRKNCNYNIGVSKPDTEAPED